MYFDLGLCFLRVLRNGCHRDSPFKMSV